MDQTKSIELQKKRLESAEERARTRASSACAQTRWLLCMIKVVQLKSMENVLINRSVLSPPPSRFWNLQPPNVNTKIQGVGSLAM